MGKTISLKGKTAPDPISANFPDLPAPNVTTADGRPSIPSLLFMHSVLSINVTGPKTILLISTSHRTPILPQKGSSVKHPNEQENEQKHGLTKNGVVSGHPVWHPNFA
jgi:hypothetical protein